MSTNISKFKSKKPSRKDLYGFSPSEFKTLLKKNNYKIPRNFYKIGSVAKYKNRLFRFRWWSADYSVDISCSISDFDRWANSTEKTLHYQQWSRRKKDVSDLLFLSNTLDE
jgi:hypothetical protein